MGNRNQNVVQMNIKLSCNPTSEFPGDVIACLVTKGLNLTSLLTLLVTGPFIRWSFIVHNTNDVNQ